MRETVTTSLDQMHRGYGRAELVKILFEEWNVSRQCATGAGGRYIPEYAEGPSGGFYANELGFGRHNPEADVLHTSRTARTANAERKRQLKKDHERMQAALKLDAERLGKRPILEPWRDPTGCKGCRSCVPGARVAPPTIKLSGSFSEWRWTPNSLPLEQQAVVALLQTAAKTLRRAIREQQAVTSFLRTAAAAVRRARKEERSEAYKARKERHAGARAQMQARREEEKNVRRAARRALGVSSSTRR